MLTAPADRRPALPHHSAATYPDPLDGDNPHDRELVVTERQLIRLALVASEVGARFQRDGGGVDPMGWMLASRSLFDGASAVDACLRLDGCLRAVLLHGLAHGLDADPDEIDDLLDEEDRGRIAAASWRDAARGGAAVDRATFH